MIVQGSLTLPPNSTMQIELSDNNSTIPVTVTGTAQLGGTLIVVVPPATPDNTTRVLMTASEITGGFDSIETVQTNSRCKRASAAYAGDNANTIAVVISVQNKCKSKNQAGKIAGITIGVAIALGLIVVGAWLLLKHFNPSNPVFAYQAMEDVNEIR